MKKKTQAKLLGRYIVADPEICHGQPTFRGTRIMVWQVLEMLADGMAWETIVEECHNSITKDAIAEAIKSSGTANARPPTTPRGSGRQRYQLSANRRSQP